ncbi:DnaJ like protein subfamily C member 17 [Dufourea novaeangliae]|uniref:DnaJ homolog subfamily C member 17 n=1 Tax=Dufourea novaeangliae TaxID=178035 RepID=A0A154P3K1_DUFNO|nr:DnaJ like protein subfamily C member 17 [Dufourea novaeangliae]
MDSWIDQDLYELIGVTNTATIQEIKRGYRKKALSCHPDKNPDNPKATELFHDLSRALEILTDVSARAAYDKVINAKSQAKIRAKEFDAKRRKLKEDLEAREDAYQRSLNKKSSTNSDKDKLQAEIERLQKEGSKQVEEEIARMKRKIKQESKGSCKATDTDSSSYKIKIKWKSNKNDIGDNVYDYDTLHRIFSKYGDIVTLIYSSTRKGRALVEYQDRDDAEMALNLEVGFTQNPLKLQKLWNTMKQSNFSEDESAHVLTLSINITFQINQSELSDAEFERIVLSNLRKAQEEKRHSEMLNSKEGT